MKNPPCPLTTSDPPGFISHRLLLTYPQTSPLFFSLLMCLLFLAPSLSRLHTHPILHPLSNVWGCFTSKDIELIKDRHIGKKNICRQCHMTHRPLMSSPPQLWRTCQTSFFIFVFFTSMSSRNEITDRINAGECTQSLSSASTRYV